ncbi:MAG: hypothetical protein ACPF9D_04850, partial [Owenweeksia sp.]
MKKIILFSILSIAIGIAAVFVIPQFFKEDLKKSLADALNIDPENLILNLPPSPGRYPGSILLAHHNDYLSYVPSYDSIAEKGTPFSIRKKMNSIGDFGSSSAGEVLSNVFNNMEHFDIELNINNARVLELPIPRLKSFLQGNQMVMDAINRQKDLVVLHKAIEGVVSYEIKAKDSKGIEILSDVESLGKELGNRNANLSVSGTVSSNNQLSFALSTPIIIAYQALKVNYVVNNLSHEEGEVVLNTITNTEMAELSSSTHDAPSVNPSAVSWGLITIGSAHYQNLAALNTPEVVKSVSLVESSLSAYQPSFVKKFLSSKSTPLEDDSLMAWSIDLTMELFSNPVDYLVIYYTGHGLSLPNGELVLLQGNANRDFAERAAETMTVQTGEPGDGLLLAETLYDAFSVTGIPFTLILDACYPNDEMQDALTRVSMSTTSADGSGLVYHGDQNLITDEMDQLHDAQQGIGERFAYRTS